MPLDGWACILSTQLCKHWQLLRNQSTVLCLTEVDASDGIITACLVDTKTRLYEPLSADINADSYCHV